MNSANNTAQGRTPLVNKLSDASALSWLAAIASQYAIEGTLKSIASDQHWRPIQTTRDFDEADPDSPLPHCMPTEAFSKLVARHKRPIAQESTSRMQQHAHL